MAEERVPREQMEYDVVVVGARAGRARRGDPAEAARGGGRAADPVCVIEKGSEVGAHILSGAVFEPRALDELFPDWRERGAPLVTPATDDRFLLLTATRAWRLPTPPQMHNRGNYIISLGNLCRWLASQAEALGVEIYPGFAGAEVLYDDAAGCAGSPPAIWGSARTAAPTANYQPGVELHARRDAVRRGLPRLADQAPGRAVRSARRHRSADLWHRRQGTVGGAEAEQHHPAWSSTPSAGRSTAATYGGSFLYHLENRQVAVGMVVGLDYKNPYPVAVRGIAALQDASGDPPDLRRRAAHRLWRARPERGRLPVDPEARFPRRAADRRAAGFVNVPKIKGSHTAMKSGMVAAETVVPPRSRASRPPSYRAALEDSSWIWRELRRAQHPAGLPLGPVRRRSPMPRSTPMSCAAARRGRSATRRPHERCDDSAAPGRSPIPSPTAS